MGGTKYLAVLDVEALNAFIMRKTGEPPALLRDRALLESAVARPRMAAHYADADLVLQAVTLMVGISQAQAFVDGNKRTGFLAAQVFLRLNGCRFLGDSLELAHRLEAACTAEGRPEAQIGELADFLREYVLRGDSD